METISLSTRLLLSEIRENLYNVAVQALFGNDEIDVKTLRGAWPNVKGFETTVAYHPLAVRRRPNLKFLFEQDWELIAEQYRQINLS